MKFNPHPQNFIPKLTALWAVSESGMGGLMHAIGIPFSGIFLGSFAVIIVSYLAAHANNRFKTILQATFLVILIKAIASPHSPVAAYIAVSFQGIIGAIIYQYFGFNRISSLLYASLALLESAFQKIITLTLIFGMRLWDAIGTFFNEIAEQFNQNSIEQLPYIILIIYCMIYLIVGIIAGTVAFGLPSTIKTYASRLQIPQKNSTIPSKKRRKKWKYLLIPVALFFSAAIFLITGNSGKAAYILWRTLAALVFVLYIFNPLFTWLIQKWVSNARNRKNENLDKIMQLTPEIRSNADLALQMVKNESNWLSKMKYFLLNWLSLSLYYEKTDM